MRDLFPGANVDFSAPFWDHFYEVPEAFPLVSLVGATAQHLLPIARGALPETTALIGVSPNVGGHITDGDSALTTKFPFRSHCGLIGGTVMRRSAALTSDFPSQQGVDLSCQSVLRHALLHTSEWLGCNRHKTLVRVVGHRDPQLRIDLRLVPRLGLSEHLGHVSEALDE